MMDSPTTILASASTQASLYTNTSPPRRKRRPAGTPDPDAEVIALSPTTLMESDRYVCEICNQGFQRDQNLQMHRRRHKVPWKLLKRVSPEVSKRVYVCPEPSCLHHDPSHALGDLVGIKKHYRRKHSSVKQWECDKCGKAYAVQSDYKAHLKTCGTRGHCCNCGRVFSRVESFIEHQDTCTEARNKKGSGSSELEVASLPSLGVLTAHHTPRVPTNLSNFAKEVTEGTHLHHVAGTASSNFPQMPQLHANNQGCGDTLLLPLPVRTSACPASPARALATREATIPATVSSSPLIIPASPPNAVGSPQHPVHGMVPLQATQDGHRMSCKTQQPCDISHDHLSLRHHKAELQLLPTSKAHLNQLESSQSSVTWGRDMASTNSTTSGVSSSPASKTVDDKGAGCTEVRPAYFAGGSADISAATAAPCKLQLSIGLSNIDLSGYNGKPPSSHVSGTNIANEENKSEQLDTKATSVPWLAWSAFPLNVSDPPETEQSDLMYGSIQQADPRMCELRQFVEALNFSSGVTSVSHEKPSFSLGADLNAPAAATEAAEVLLQTAREELRRASAEKLEAEKAWREARKERERAEEELAKVQRIAEYNRAIARGKGRAPFVAQKQDEEGDTRKASAGSSSPCNSIANSQSSSSSLQTGQVLQAGGEPCGALSFITCPTCHHTQILYPSPTDTVHRSLASPVELTPAYTQFVAGGPHIKGPASSPPHLL